MRAIKISDRSHRRLKMMSAKSGEHIYQIVDDLVQRISDNLLGHATGKDHKLNPGKCDGCKDVSEAMLRDRKR